MYGVEQSTTMPYNLHGNATCERFNHILMDLLKSLSKEQKGYWQVLLPSLIIAYDSIPHSTTG